LTKKGAILLQTLKIIGLFSLLIIVAWLFNGCGDVTDTSTASFVGLSISPASVSVKVGSTQEFTAVAVYSDGSESSVIPTWSVSGEIGSVIRVGYTGLFTATLEGSGLISAAYSTGVAWATLEVTASTEPDVLDTITLSPANVLARVEASQIFTATGLGASLETISISPTWEITGDAIGNLTTSGRVATLEITAEGSATISCVSGEVIGYSYVTIEGFVLEITAEADTFVDETNPTVIYYSDTSLKAGYVSVTDRYYESYFRFPLTLIPAGASIESATLGLYASSVGSYDLQLKALTSDFSATTNWSTKPSIGSYLLSSSFSADSYNSLSGDALTSLVRDWLSGATPNYGLALLQEGGVDGVVVNVSVENVSNPSMLRLEYTIE